MNDSIKVGVLAYDGLHTFAYSIIEEIFGKPNPGYEPWYQCETIGAIKGELSGDGGVYIRSQNGLERLDHMDMIVVPGWSSADGAVSEELKAKIRLANARGVRIVSICTGIFLLAACGIIKDREIVVPPASKDWFSEKYPDIAVNTTSVYVESENLISSAGAVAAIDMTLYIARQNYGAKAANQVARRLVVPVYHEGNQAQFIARSMPVYADGHIGMILENLREKLDENWDVKSLSNFANVSPRTLQRRFKEATGLSPQAWLTKERVELAKDILETTTMNIQQIANVTGMKTPEAFRHHFKRLVGINPTKYRNRFKAAPKEKVKNLRTPEPQKAPEP